MAWEYYKFLGVDRTATQEEVSRAYARKTRELVVAKDEKGREYLNEVAATLKDPKAREQYDRTQEYGPEFERVMTEAMAARQDERWSEAERLLKRALVLMPNDETVLNQLAICQAHGGNSEAATATFKKLVTVQPEVALYWSNYA